MAKVLIDEYLEIEDAVRFRQRGSYVIQYGEESFRERLVSFVDQFFFNVFSVPLLKGDPKTALASPNTLILSRNTAEKYFRDENPVGKTLKLDNKEDYKVTGVFEEIPDNSHFHFDIILSMPSLAKSKSPIWLNNNFQNYILLGQDAAPEALEAKFPGLIVRHMGPQVESFLGKSMEKLVAEGDIKAEYYFQPLRDIHLHSDLLAEIEPNSNIKYVYIFSAIALFILIIASINFMNLSTTRSAERAKEVGVRKALGSYRRHLIG